MYSIIPVRERGFAFNKTFWEGIEFSEKDKEEIELLSDGKEIGLAVVEAIVASKEAFLIEIDGFVQGVFGLCDNTCWLLCTDEVRLNKKSLVKEAKKIVEGWLNVNEILNGFVLNDNHKSIKFLKHLGFDLNPVPDTKFLGYSKIL